MHSKRPSLYKKQQGKRWSHHFRDYKPLCFLPCYRTIWYYIPRTIWQMCNSVQKTIEWFHSLCQTQYRLILAPRVNAFILQKNYLNNWKNLKFSIKCQKFVSPSRQGGIAMAFRHWLFLPLFWCLYINTTKSKISTLKKYILSCIFLIYSSAMNNKHKMFRTKEFIGPIIAWFCWKNVWDDWYDFSLDIYL